MAGGRHGPDLAFVANETIEGCGRGAGQRFFRGAPDLAVEIESPNDRKPEIHVRAREYLDAGAKLVWTIHPKSRTAIDYRCDDPARLLQGYDALDGGDVLPGFRITLDELSTNGPGTRYGYARARARARFSGEMAGSFSPYFQFPRTRTVSRASRTLSQAAI